MREIVSIDPSQQQCSQPQRAKVTTTDPSVAHRHVLPLNANHATSMLLNHEEDGYSSDDSLKNLCWLPQVGTNNSGLGFRRKREMTLPPQPPRPPSQTTTSTDASGGGTDSRRPPFSYVQLICMALASQSDMRLPITEIYEWVQRNFPYYSQKSYYQDWRSSIRHNLALHADLFKKTRAFTQQGHSKAAYHLNISIVAQTSLLKLICEYREHQNSQHISKFTSKIIFDLQRQRHKLFQSKSLTGSSETLSSAVSSCSSHDSGVSFQSAMSNENSLFVESGDGLAETMDLFFGESGNNNSIATTLSATSTAENFTKNSKFKNRVKKQPRRSNASSIGTQTSQESEIPKADNFTLRKEEVVSTEMLLVSNDVMEVDDSLATLFQDSNNNLFNDLNMDELFSFGGGENNDIFSSLSNIGDEFP